jgi:hypothetical protein
MCDSSNSQSKHFFTFDEADKPKFRKIKKIPFNVETKFETTREQMDNIGCAFLKLTSAYVRNNIFGIIRQSNLFYDASIKLIYDISMMLKQHHGDMPIESRQKFTQNIKSIGVYAAHLQKVKDDWVAEFSQSNDPDFDVLVQNGEERLNEIMLEVEKLEKLGRLFGNNDLAKQNDCRM